jgi:heat-inducible transcriptional repressor
MDKGIKKRSKKESREYGVLLGLVELYIKIGKPIGSSTLKENGFDSLSSATIRNYFAELEKEGYLKQPHSSGGRIPTTKAFRFYADHCLESAHLEEEIETEILVLKDLDTKNLGHFLQKAADVLAEVTGFAPFLSAPRFDHDFILDVKLLSLDASRLLCVLITNFGQIFTETVSFDHKMSTFSLKRLESYFLWKLKNGTIEEKPSLTEEEEALAQKLYSEILVRYLVRYSNFSNEEIIRTGFSKLLAYPEFNDPLSLTMGLSLFENTSQMAALLQQTMQGSQLRFWVGEEFSPSCAVIAVPYRINQIQAGAIGLLGPTRMPYKTLFATLTFFSEILSEALTKTLYKFKLSFRGPKAGAVYAIDSKWKFDEKSPYHLLEIKENP